MATDDPRSTTFSVDVLTRVEGEGRFRLVVRDGQVREATLSIFEAPRFFEALLRGRSPYEVPDVVARICGICPVAYQLSAARALEQALGLRPPPRVAALRRLLYCGEWIESHALHVFLLHAPDFLGFPSALEMAAAHRDVVDRALRLKRAGNRLVEVLGGRAVHPVSVRVGGFTRGPRRAELRAVRAELAAALGEAVDAVSFVAGLPAPRLEVDYTFVALDADRYPLEAGDAVRISGRSPVAVAEWETAFVEAHVPHSTALQCRLADGTPYLCGPLARWFHHEERLHPAALAAARAVGLQGPVRNPYRSIVVRMVEIVHALAEAIDLCDDDDDAEPTFVDGPPRAGTGFGATEAPRGLLWHRYDLADDGTVAAARIVPPTAQNQARIESDLASLAPELLALEHGAAQLRCEQLIRSYDPCISCATHFLELDIDRGTA